MTKNNRKLDNDINKLKIDVCKKCIYDERVPSIFFDDKGICNYCNQVEQLKALYGTGEPKGEKKFKKILSDIKIKGRGKRYDCIIGVSGGTDSSYLLYLAKKKWKLRPLAVHYDNTWNTAIATMNIQKMLSALDVDLFTHVVNNKEADDIFRSFFLAGVAEMEASTDLGYAYLLRKVAAKYKIKYIFEGHSFIEEGVTPLGRNYFDGKYIKSIHRRFGNQKMKTYPLMTMSRFLWSILFHRTKFIRPFWYIKYNKKSAIEFLSKKFDWSYYGGHHLENRSAAFCHTIYFPKKFNIDLRNNTIAAKVRNGSISREAGWQEYNEPPKISTELISFVKKRLRLSESEYKKILGLPPKSWQDYPSYKKQFELLRPIFFILAKIELVPMSFYLKYCFPTDKPDDHNR